MLSYQPIRSLATLNMSVYQGTAAAKRIFKIIDEKIKIKNNKDLPEINIKKANIRFKDVSFNIRCW